VWSETNNKDSLPHEELMSMKNNCNADTHLMKDEELLIRIKNADKIAYNIIVERYLTKLWRLGMSIFHNASEAEDAVQDVLLSVWQNRANWKDESEGGAKFSTWIYRVMLNRCIDIKRKRKPSSGVDIIDDVTSDKRPDAENILVKSQNSTQLLAHLMQIPEKQRLALLLFYYDELSIKEISDKLSLNEPAIRSLLKRGRTSLKERFENESITSNLGELQEYT